MLFISHTSSRAFRPQKWLLMHANWISCRASVSQGAARTGALERRRSRWPHQGHYHRRVLAARTGYTFHENEDTRGILVSARTPKSACSSVYLSLLRTKACADVLECAGINWPSPHTWLPPLSDSDADDSSASPLQQDQPVLDPDLEARSSCRRSDGDGVTTLCSSNRRLMPPPPTPLAGRGLRPSARALHTTTMTLGASPMHHRRNLTDAWSASSPECLSPVTAAEIHTGRAHIPLSLRQVVTTVLPEGCQATTTSTRQDASVTNGQPSLQLLSPDAPAMLPVGEYSASLRRESVAVRTRERPPGRRTRPQALDMAPPMSPADAAATPVPASATLRGGSVTPREHGAATPPPTISPLKRKRGAARAHDGEELILSSQKASRTAAGSKKGPGEDVA